MFRMRMIKKNRKRLVILSVALFMICGVALGYAALSSSIKINGTGTISTNWDILFTNIEEKSSKGAVNNDSRIMGKLTATFDVNLESPGSYIEYNVTIKNNGNTDAVIAKVTGIVEANNEAPRGIQFGIRGLRIGDDLLASSEKTFVVRAEIPTGETTLPTTSKTLELTVEVRQKEVDSSGLVTTIGECFETNAAGDTITGYLCGKGNTNGYSEITNVNIPREINGHTITIIGGNAFNNKGLTSVLLPNGITKIDSHAFMSNSLTRITIPNSVKTIGNSVFSGNTLTEIDIPSSVTSIGTSAFTNNKMPIEKAFIYNRNSDGTENKDSLNSYAGSATEVILPENITVIGNLAFHGSKIRQIVLHDQLTMIGGGAFQSNHELTSVVIPASVTSIGGSSFAGCWKLSSVEFKGNVPNIDQPGVFANSTPLMKENTIKVPAGTLEQYKTARAGSYSTGRTWFGSDNASLDAFYE